MDQSDADRRALARLGITDPHPAALAYRRSQDDEALLLEAVEDFIASEGLWALISLGGVREVVRQSFALEVAELREHSLEEEHTR